MPDKKARTLAFAPMRPFAPSSYPKVNDAEAEGLRTSGAAGAISFAQNVLEPLDDKPTLFRVADGWLVVPPDDMRVLAEKDGEKEAAVVRTRHGSPIEDILDRERSRLGLAIPTYKTNGCGDPACRKCRGTYSPLPDNYARAAARDLMRTGDLPDSFKKDFPLADAPRRNG